MSQSSQEEDDQISPLEYARQNGLSQDYLASNLGFPELKQIQEDLAGYVDIETNLPSFDFGGEVKVEERLSCSKDAATLLAWVAREHSSNEIDALMAPFFKETNSRNKKLELPLLLSDADCDCRKFASREGFEMKLRDVKLPLEAVGEREGFHWTKQYENLGTTILQNLKAEKLGVTREAMAFLQACANVTWTEEDETQLWRREQSYKRRTALNPITPPLSPLPEPLQPFEPSSSDSALHIPFFSDPPSPTTKDLKALEEEIFKQDLPTPIREFPAGGFTLEELSHEQSAAHENAPSPEPRPSKWSNFKVEVPLMPDEPVTFPKTVRFDDQINAHLYERLSNSPMALEDESKFFESFEDAYTAANLEAEQEKLSREDTTTRVDVPDLKFAKTDAPWKPFEDLQNQAALADLQKSFLLKTIASGIPDWHGAREQESKLPWAPFTSNFAKLALEDDVPTDDTTWKAFVEDDGNIIDSSSLTWTRAGLKILNDEDDEEEIDFGVLRKDTPPNLSVIVKKRKKELQEREGSGNNDPAGATGSKPGTSLIRGSPKPAVAATATGAFGFFDGGFSVQASLNNYLEHRGLKRTKIAESSYFTKTGETHSTRDKSRDETPKGPSMPIRKSPANKEKIPVLDVQPLTANTWIVVSTTLLKNRTLINSIGAQLPSVKLIERDFKAHNTSAWMPGSVTRSPVKSTLDTEADIIVSPSVGIILTTLLTVRQKPLPGQKKVKPEIYQRVERVTPRYEKLIVLISEGKAEGVANRMTESDCIAFAEFAGFLSGFDTSICMQYVGGGEETLSKWIVSNIIQYRMDTELIADETFWELFLRRAGLNAFAAQAVIGELKAPDGVDPGTPSKAGLFGLTSFVEMGEEDRLARLGNICGARVLARVSAVVDSRWD
ncbi:hypothetical protein BKA64DRAFT_375362 [Cadophora sp. MPI-SDFR-AT-0126]|nr:hypothetical protein BKA64DRAFT_375362 [Leotiomycetes sp. MPI-SDFR-AT-0126]